ncbi:hypothetical protein ACI2UK_24455 [Ralstonia nicotianae]|uniref:hypothetical protein n=1 Tax=Ralstonia pseudosolanacearum TaxID=1310165 RepID=UPI0020042696|nr:hypothetical protein [Ralstonia pseudosolanacearum]MCK4120407.1 hypothetical protein [Ralstonia pseudosolanacearum]
MLLRAITRKSLDGRGDEPGTTRAIEIEQLGDGSFLLMRYESGDATVLTSDHWYETLEEAFEECDHVYGVGRDDWQSRDEHQDEAAK